MKSQYYIRAISFKDRCISFSKALMPIIEADEEYYINIPFKGLPISWDKGETKFNVLNNANAKYLKLSQTFKEKRFFKVKVIKNQELLKDETPTDP
ncbi:MAG: hypothetical protein HYY52_06755 [Candidatus Melainabacteria bacterium]|nr:hypothetical protein [Candidatus Melainabacteria bacterium]